MKTTKLRLISALLALAMLLAMVSVGAWAEEDTTSKKVIIQAGQNATPVTFLNDDGSVVTSSSGYWSYDSTSKTLTLSTGSTQIRYYIEGTIPSYITVKTEKIAYLCSGIFNRPVENHSRIYGGTYNGTVDNYGGIYDTVSLPVFYGTVTNQSTGTIYEGTFNSSLSNYGTVNITKPKDGLINGTFHNYPNATLSRGFFTSTSHFTNDSGGKVTGGYFIGTVDISNWNDVTGGVFKVNPLIASTHIKLANSESAGNIFATSLTTSNFPIGSECWDVGKQELSISAENSAWANRNYRIYWLTEDDTIIYTFPDGTCKLLTKSFPVSTELILSSWRKVRRLAIGTDGVPYETTVAESDEWSGETCKSGWDYQNGTLTIDKDCWTADILKNQNITVKVVNNGRAKGGVYTQEPEGIATEKLTATDGANINNLNVSTVYAAEGESITVTAPSDFTYWEASGITLSDKTATTLTFTMPANAVTLTAVPAVSKKSPTANDFELDADVKKITGKNDIADSDIESVVVKDAAGNTKTVTGNDLSKLDPGTYTVVSVTTKENDSFTADTVTMPETDAWKFTIKGTTTGDNNNTTPDDGNNDAKTPTYPVSRGDYTEVTVTAPDGTKRDDDKAEKGDTVRVTLPEEDRKKGDMVFDGWDVSVEPEEKTADVLNELVKSGFKPGEPDTSFTMPELPEGTTLKFAPRYVTPDQSGSDDDSFLLTAAVVTGGAVVTGVVVYNVYARSYLKANLPEGVAIPQNREELALLLWNKAECPAPADSTLYTDVDAADANAQASARWAVENELMKPADKNDSNVFKPEKSVSVGQVYRAWKKAEALG